MVIIYVHSCRTMLTCSKGMHKMMGYGKRGISNIHMHIFLAEFSRLHDDPSMLINRPTLVSALYYNQPNIFSFAETSSHM